MSARLEKLVLPSQVLLILLNINPERQSQRKEPRRFTQSWPWQALSALVHSSTSGRNVRNCLFRNISFDIHVLSNRCSIVLQNHLCNMSILFRVENRTIRVSSFYISGFSLYSYGLEMSFPPAPQKCTENKLMFIFKDHNTTCFNLKEV